MKKIMALDVGSKYIGIAVSDPLGVAAHGLDSLIRTDLEQDIKEISRLIEEREIELLIIGMPRNMNGTYGPSAEMAKQFGGYFEEKGIVPVKYWDERMTTVIAQKILVSADVSRKKRKKVVDKIAAVLILQNYLDSIN